MGAECRRCGYDIYDECGHCKVVDERDRLREALERIAGAGPHAWRADNCECPRCIARATLALKENE